MLELIDFSPPVAKIKYFALYLKIVTFKYILCIQHFFFFEKADNCCTLNIMFDSNMVIQTRKKINCNRHRTFREKLQYYIANLILYNCLKVALNFISLSFTIYSHSCIHHTLHITFSCIKSF